MYDPNCKICHQQHPANVPHIWPTIAHTSETSDHKPAGGVSALGKAFADAHSTAIASACPVCAAREQAAKDRMAKARAGRKKKSNA